MRNLLFVALIACVAFAQQTIWDGAVDTTWFDGGKTTFEISTAQQLAGLAVLVDNGNDFKGKSVKLTADIWLNDTADFQNWEKNAPKNQWVQIGVYNVMIPRAMCKGFAGNFDGNAKTIFGMYINAEGNKMKSAALFGYLGAEAVVTNLNVTSFYVSNDGILTAPVAGANLGKIQNCEVNGGTANGGLWVGGLTGSTEEGQILDNKVRANVIGMKIVGGISGEINIATLTGNYFEGNVQGNRETGNLVGRVGGATTIIKNNKAKPVNTQLSSFGNVKGNTKKAEIQ